MRWNGNQEDRVARGRRATRSARATKVTQDGFATIAELKGAVERRKGRGYLRATNSSGLKRKKGGGEGYLRVTTSGADVTRPGREVAGRAAATGGQ